MHSILYTGIAATESKFNKHLIDKESDVID